MRITPILHFAELNEEREFLRHDCANNIGWAKFCYASGALLWAAFGLLDIVVAPESVVQLSIVRFGVGLPVLLFAFTSTFHRPLQKRLKETGLAVTLLCGAAIIIMENLLPITSTHGYFVGIILVLVYAFSFGQLTFRYAVISGILLTASFVAIELTRLRFPPDVILSKSAFLSAAVYIGLFSCGILEHHRRREFIDAKKARETNKRLIDLAKALEHESTHDELTGLLNRRQLEPLFNDMKRRLTSNNVVSSIMLIDLDKFKNINDFFGHLVGDKALQEISKIFTSLNEENFHTIRIGGDEFVVICPGHSIRDCEDFLAEISESFQHWKAANAAARTADLGISIGIAEVNSEFDNLESVLQRADRALYEKKRRRKRGFVSTLPERRTIPSH